jgi:hypothetical protein
MQLPGAGVEAQIHTIIEAMMNRQENLDNASNREMWLMVADAIAFVDGKCKRRFIRENVTTIYDAPGNSVLYMGREDSCNCEILDATLVPAASTPVVEAYGVPLVPEIEYVLRLNSFGTAYSSIERYVDGKAIRWDKDATGHPRNRITIIADHGWKYLPGEIRRAYIMVASRLWKMHQLHYTGDGGPLDLSNSGGSGLWDENIHDLCRRFMREPVPQEGIAWE